MADGVTITSGANSTAPDGTVVSTDDAGASGHVQRVKLTYSADGSATHIPADADGLLVNLGTNNDVTIADGGGSITVDGTVSVSGTVTVDASGAAVPVTDNGGSLTVDGSVTIADGGNTVQREASTAIPASGSANVASNGSVTVVAIVAGNATYKVRAARGNTTLTGTWVAMDGAGVGVTNNLTDNSDKGSHIIAVRIA